MHPYTKTFARAYNQMWTDFADRVAPRIIEFYKNTGPGKEKKPLLDLCCGVGTNSLHFLAAGFETVGVDLSPHMLEFARDNAREYIEAGKAKFVNADATEFDLAEKGSFGIAISTFDSLNHLENSDDLKKVMKNVFEELSPGGYFIFDLNTRKGLESWDSIEATDTDEMMLLRRGGFDEDGGQAFYRATGFLKDPDGRYSRFEQTVVERVYVMEDVKKWVLDTGFSEVMLSTHSFLGEPVEDPESETRVAFIARK